MKLDTKHMRYLTADDWRVLQAVETGSRNHEVVPTSLIHSLSRLRSPSAVSRSISSLAKSNLIARLRNAAYDGYRLTYGGLDYLALHAHSKTGTIYSVGNQIGVGKESDIYVCAAPTSSDSAYKTTSPLTTGHGHERSGTTAQRVLKIHRLGRISFRTVKANRDYLRNRKGGSWMYMSRLAAVKEHAFMVALRKSGFPVPMPLGQSRHTVVMELIDAFPLRQISLVPDPAGLYAELIALIMRLARHGLIHGDFNEFNILIREDPVIEKTEQPTQNSNTPTTSSTSSSDASLPPRPTRRTSTTTPTPTPSMVLTPILIDFPQMVSMDHANAAFYFDRDVACTKRFFARRFGFTSSVPGPTYADARRELEDAMRAEARAEAAAAAVTAASRPKSNGAAAKTSSLSSSTSRLDVQVEASGFSRKMARELETYMRDVGVDGDGGGGGDGSDVDRDDEDEEEDEDEEGEEGKEGDGDDHDDHDNDDDIDNAVDAAPDDHECNVHADPRNTPEREDDEIKGGHRIGGAGGGAEVGAEGRAAGGAGGGSADHTPANHDPLAEVEPLDPASPAADGPSRVHVQQQHVDVSRAHDGGLASSLSGLIVAEKI